MKQILRNTALLTLLLCCCIGAPAQPNCVTVTANDGSKVQMLLVERPKITGDASVIVVSGSSTRLTYNRDEVRTITMGEYDDPTDVAPIGADVAGGIMRQTVNTLLFSGFSPKSNVTVCGINGQIFFNGLIGADGALQLSLDGLQRGVYIVKTDSLTYKILKR